MLQLESHYQIKFHNTFFLKTGFTEKDYFTIFLIKQLFSETERRTDMKTTKTQLQECFI